MCTRDSMDAQCACVYTDISNSYIYGESNQLDQLILNSEGLICSRINRFYVLPGDTICFLSIASARTCLLRNGYKYSHNSYAYNENITYQIEIWIRNIWNLILNYSHQIKL